MGTTITIGGFVVGNVDGKASVLEAYEKLQADPSALTQAAYNAAYANAIAAETALIPGAGAYFASRAINADLVDIAQNGISASNGLALTGNLVTLFGQGVQIVGVASTAITGPGGVVLFTAGEIADALGLALIATSAIVDSAAIHTWVTTILSELGLSQDSNGNYLGQSPSTGSSYSITDSSGSLNTTYAGESTTATTTTGDGVDTVIVITGNVSTGTSTVEVFGKGGTVDQSNLTITVDTGSSSTFTGTGNAIHLATGATAIISPQSINDIITMATNGTVIVDNGASCSIVGAATPGGLDCHGYA